MARYIKTMAVFPLEKFAEQRKKYENLLSFTYITPGNHYVWLQRRNEVIFIKRSNFNVHKLTPCFATSIIFESKARAKEFCLNVTRKQIHRLFKKTKTIYL